VPSSLMTPHDKRTAMLDAIESFWAANGSRSLSIRAVIGHAQAVGVVLTSQTVYTYFKTWGAACTLAGVRLSDDYAHLVAMLRDAGSVVELGGAWAEAALARPALLRVATTGRNIRGADGECVAAPYVRQSTEQLAILVGGWANHATLLGLTQALAAERLTWLQFSDAVSAKLGPALPR
jgi:hypothetical protein